MLGRQMSTDHGTIFHCPFVYVRRGKHSDNYCLHVQWEHNNMTMDRHEVIRDPVSYCSRYWQKSVITKYLPCWENHSFNSDWVLIGMNISNCTCSNFKGLLLVFVWIKLAIDSLFWTGRKSCSHEGQAVEWSVGSYDAIREGKRVFIKKSCIYKFYWVGKIVVL